MLIQVGLKAQKAQDPAEDSLREAHAKDNKVRFTPVVAPSFAPETRLMFNLGGLLTFRLTPDDTNPQRSSVPFSFGYSTNKSLYVNFRPFIYSKDDNVRLYGDIWIKDMPDNYWGAGYHKGKRVSDPDSTTEYHRDWWQINLNTVLHIQSHLFAGFNVDLNETKPTEINPYMQQDPLIREGGSRIRNSGFGFVIQYDSRDLPVNAYSGVYFSLTSTFYGNFLNGNNKYSIYQIDYRHFFPIQRKGRTLALQIKNRFGTGNVPWPEMSQLGNPFDLRGYRWGRFRDENMLFGIVEYRHMFMRKTPNKKSGRLMSRSGIVLWLGTGSVASSLKEMDNWLPNAGIGYRFEIQSRMNARLDIGFGEDSKSLYVSFNEAF